MQITTSAFGEKKMFLVVSMIVLLAVGCGAKQQGQTTSQQSTTQTNPAPSAQNPSSPTTGNATTSTGSTWQGTLEKSNNAVKGTYMISVNGHNVYINTSRDYSALEGKQVTVHYKGTMDSFGLIDITAE